MADSKVLAARTNSKSGAVASKVDSGSFGTTGRGGAGLQGCGVTKRTGLQGVESTL